MGAPAHSRAYGHHVTRRVTTHAMDIHVTPGQIESFDADAIVVNLFEGVKSPGGATGAVDAALGGQITDLVAGGDFSGKLGETAVLYSRGTVPAARVVIVGLGKPDRFDLDAVGQASAAAVKAARERGARHVATIVHGAGFGVPLLAAWLRAVVADR